MSDPRVITFFSEDRLATNARGDVVSADRDLAHGAWARGLPDPNAARFAARVDKDASIDGYRVEGEVRRLPYYQGVAGLFRCAPGMTVAVWRAVRESSTIAVRLPGFVGLLAVVAAMMQRRRVIVEVVGDIQQVLQSGVGGRLGRWLARPAAEFTRWAVRRGHVVRYVTTNRLQNSYPPNATAEVFAFSDVLLEDEDFARTSITLHPSPRVIAIGSQEQMYKGHDLLIAAIAALRQNGHDVSLALLGQGRCQTQLRAQARRLGVEGSVEFMGHVSPRSAVRRELDRAWVYAMPSRTEGLPRALVEAMARAKPCVVSDVGGMPELVDRAFVIEPDAVQDLVACLDRLIVDEGLRTAVGERNLEKTRQMWRRQAQEVGRWQSRLIEIAGEVG